MYSIRSHNSENLELDLPTTMYRVQPVIQQTQIGKSTNESTLKDIENRQDVLLEKLNYLSTQLTLYQDHKINSIPIREELVVHLSAKQPSKNILNLIEQFRDKLSIRIFYHSSVRDASLKNQAQNLSSTNHSNTNRALTIIWADSEDLPFMFHSHMKINDEKLIMNTLSDQLTNKN
ncbi:unnamed protein product [Adineta steineri]|uniref:AIMP2 thioredoxin-like domain-containing protein n=1 Tax=Adineta steineri TaxID=433720 RepID=A0A818XA27_9BILA|nr:unnamed protein product [Adineta steineri]CAF3734239.1 unnamed protein product [Adineta steineri]